MANKKLFKILALSTLGVLGLTACGEIQAKPTNYSDPLITVEGYDKDIYNNLYSVVYDSIRDGNLGSDVLGEVLYRYATQMFGSFDKFVTPAPAEDEVTLTEAYLDITSVGSDFSKARAFLNAHKVYWTLDEDGNRKTGDETNEFKRIQAKYETIVKRYAEKMYEKCNNDSFKDRKMFYESKFLDSLLSGLENVANPDTLTSDHLTEGLLITPDIEPYQVFDTINEKKILHIENYMGESFHYIEEKLIPEIYKQLLNEQYLLDETYNTLGRSYARKVNIIKIADNSDHPKTSDYLAKALIQDINAVPDATTIKESTKVTLDALKAYSRAYLVGGEELATIISNHPDLGLGNIFTLDEVGGLPYYKGTSLGDLLARYSKIQDDILLTDTDEENKFTNNNAYTKETGLMLEMRDLQTQDSVTTGWFIKNGELNDLPEVIRNRLFSIGTSNGVIEFETSDTEVTRNDVDRYYYDSASSSWKYDATRDQSSYIARINGVNYLKNSSRITSDLPEPAFNDVLFYEGGAYYVVQVEEAVSSSKFNKSSENNSSYSVSRPDDFETIINEVSKIVGVSESYSTLATKHYLEKIDLKYHDQVVYDYFKTNYPELFK